MYKSRSLNEINVKATHVNLRNLDISAIKSKKSSFPRKICGSL